MAPIEEQKDELESARNEVEREFKAKYNKTWVFQTLCKHVIVKLGFDPYKGKEEYQRFFLYFSDNCGKCVCASNFERGIEHFFGGILSGKE